MVSVVVADDNQDNRYITAELIREIYGVTVAEAQNGRELVDLVKAESPGLVITDFSMPLMTGLDAAREIRAYSVIPIIMITANDEIRNEALAAGVNEVIVKGDGTYKLITVVNKYIPNNS